MNDKSHGQDDANESAWAACPTPSCDGRVRDPAVEGVTVEDTCPVCGRRFAFESDPDAPRRSVPRQEVMDPGPAGGTPPSGGLPPGLMGGGISQRVARVHELNINIPGGEFGVGGGTRFVTDDMTMTDESAQSESESEQYVVYTMTEDANPLHFLEVVDSAAQAQEEMERWWLAFHEEEKEVPRDYGGISYRHVSTYEDWNDAE